MNESAKNELDCRQCLEMLDAFHDMELSTDEAARVEMHLSDCSQCRLELAEIEKVVASLQALPAVEMKRDLADIIESKIVAADIAQPQMPVPDGGQAANVVSISLVRSRRWFYAAAAAAALIIFGLRQLAPPATVSTEVASLPPVHSGAAAPPEKIASSGNGTPAGPSRYQEIIGEVPNSGEVPHKMPGKEILQPEPTQPALRGGASGVAASSAHVESVAPQVRQADIERKILAGVGNKNNAQSDLNNNHISDGDEIVALYGDGESDTGLSTSEDGLYAIKL